MKDGLQYSISYDSTGKRLEGGKSYKMLLSSPLPICNFWSIIAYDCETKLIIRTDQPWPSVHSNIKNLVTNPDGSVTAWFGPEPPSGKEHNWIKTIPCKNWYLILRLYDTDATTHENLWAPGEVTELNN